MKKWLTCLLLAMLAALLGAALAVNDTMPNEAACAHEHPQLSVDWPESVQADVRQFEVAYSVICKDCGADLQSYYYISIAQRQIFVDGTCTTASTATYTLTLPNKKDNGFPKLTQSKTYPIIPAKGHDLVQHEAKAPTCTEIGWKAYEDCQRWNCPDRYTTYEELPALNHDLVQHEAKAPTCTEVGWDAYESCKREGCDYTTYNELPALGHDYESSAVEPTCTKGGYTLYTCKRCGDQYSENKTAKLGHWFGEWTPDADNAHTASCRRDGCKHTANVECTRFNYALKVEGDEIPYVFSLCPICGEIIDEPLLERVENAKALAVNEHSVLPDGELTVRMGALENGERVMSVVFELSGQPTQPDGEIQISLPAEALTGFTLVLLDADSVETPLDFTVNDETAVFTLDFTDAGTPMALIRLIPAA